MPDISEHHPGEGERPSTPVGLLRWRTARQPDELAYTFLSDGEAGEESLTYAALDARARAVGGWLQRQGAAGHRVLLLYPSGLEYIVAFFGCLYAGAVAVPAYPPRRGRSIGRLLSIAADAQATFALTTRAAVSALEPVLAENPSLRVLRWLTLGEEVESHTDLWRDPSATGETLAFLQYSSGSTSAPKGVMVSHGNLLHNQRVIQSAFQQTARSVIVGWLPLHHDMGLIGNVIQPLYLGARCVLMSPMSFLQRPARWLEAVSRYRATTSGGPNFAYDLCVRKVSAGQRAALDLSSWGVAFNGSEPVRAETLDEFAEAFAPCGFRREAFQPCYGLAEATLMVTGGRKAAPPTVRAVRAKELESNRVVGAAEGDESARRLVGCGHTFFDQSIAIVNPLTLTLCQPDEVGEIWFSGPSVAQGYWNRPEETERTFQATFEGAGGRRFLRTGDLGFVRDGELFVAGRLKDLIIILGRNHYPQDIELTAERSHPALRPHSTAAFSVEGPGVERLVVVVETASRLPADSAAVIEAIREAVAREHEVHPHAVVLVKPGGLPKTSSGKIQRYACRAMFLEKRLGVLAEWQAAGAADEDLPADADDLETWLKAFLSRKLGIDARQIDSAQPVIRYGLDSLLAVELAHAVERDFGVTLDVSQLLQNPSVAEIAARLREALPDPQRGDETAEPAPSPGATRLPLSEGQKAIWLLHQLAPQGAAYNIAAAVRINSDLNAPALRRAFEALVARHELLRTTFGAAVGEPFQLIVEGGSLSFREHDASAWGERELQDRLAAEADRPFDLERGPVMRVHLFMRSAREHVLLLSVHHIVADFWSFSVLLRELGSLYEAELKGEPATLPPLPARYADYVRRERQLLASPQGERLWEYWQSRLSGELPVLDLPTDRPRPPSQTFNGSSHAFKIEPELVRRLKGVARERGLTLYMVLLAAFEVLLYRYTGQEDLTVGSPTAGRHRAALSEVVGYFVNPVVLRERLSGEMTFESLLTRVRQTVVEAFAHQEYPFARLVERLQPARDHGRSPLFQVLFSLQKPPLHGGENFAALALGAPGARLTLGGLDLESIALEQRAAQFDLSLVMAELGGGLFASLQYNTDLLDAATAERMAQHFGALLADACAAPEKRLSELTLLSEAERRRLVIEFNDTESEYPTDVCLHELFERQAERTPAAAAVVCGGEELTYAELNGRANQLARHLRSLGVGPESRVGLLLEHSLDAVVAPLAVLKAGGAYLPLDPNSPPDRLRFMLADAGALLVLTQRRTRERLPEQFEQTEVCLDSDLEPFEHSPAPGPTPRAVPANLAYVIYTSGSTGRPKGVAVAHASVVNYLWWARRAYCGGRPLDFPLYSPLAFDLTVTSLFLPLISGARLLVYGAGDAAAPLEAVLADGRAEALKLTPAHLALLRGRDLRGSRLRLLVVGGEALEPGLARAAREACGGRAEVVNEYGPTEATVGCAAYRLGEGGAGRERWRVPAGRPVANAAAYVLDAWGGLAGVGVEGELCVGGECLARGYLGRAALTAERFTPDPFSGRAGARLYRTGDVARWAGDGRLEYVGRRDGQVKVRGFRVELGEVEAVLLEHGAVREAVVLAQETAAGDRHLVAYVVSDAAAPPQASELRDHLRTKLPDYMIPAQFVPLDALPLTPNGKIDRAALPALAIGRGAEEEYVAPRNPVEELIAGAWADLLGVERVGVHKDFFLIGGHSLLGTQVVSRLRDIFGVELTMRELFEQPTVASLAACVERMRQEGRRTTAPPVEPVAGDAPAPLSSSQQRLWFISQLEPGSALYNISGAVRLSGVLDVDALRRGLNEVVRRHESLRTNFGSRDGRPFQYVSGPLTLPVPLVDLSSHGQPQQEATRLAEEERWRPFDLSRDALIRAALLRLGEREHVLLVTMHHIVSDGWSIRILIKELAALYKAFVQGEPSPLSDLAIQYADYAHWQQRWLRGEALEEQLAYWRRQLSGLPTLDLPTDRPRPPVQTFRGAGEPLSLPQDVVEELRAIGRREGATLFMTLLAAFKLLLARYTGQPEVVVGTPVAGRTRTEVEPLVGFFANTLVLRTGLAGGPSFRELLRRVRGTALGAYAHQEVPFERLVEELAPERDTSRNPLFQAMFIFEDEEAETKSLELPDLTLGAFEVETRAAKYDLRLTLGTMGEGLRGTLEYNTALFEPQTIGRMARHFTHLLQTVASDPHRPLDTLPLLPGEERRLLLGGWNRTAADYPTGACLHELFERQAGRTPAAAAVACGGEELSYAELNGRANRLARHLRARGVGPETLVGLCVERSAAMVVGLLAVLKAGGAYVPVEASYPAERLRYMLGDSGARLLVTQRALADKLPELPVPVVVIEAHDGGSHAESAENLVNLSVPGNAAYVLYTSGSTGKPKGVVVEHRQVLNYTYGIIDGAELAPGASFAMVQPLTVDSCNTIIYPQLLTGGCIHMIAPERATDAEAFGEYMTRHRVNFLKIAPSHFLSLLKAPHTRSVMPLDRVITGGEVSYWDYMDAMLAENPRCVIFNHYGPTETTTGTVVYGVGEGRPRHSTPSVPIGRPLANVQLYVLDTRLQPVPIGARGELYIGGDSVSRGYLGRAALTAERYVPDAYSGRAGARLYRTGDVARYLADGAVEFLGRADHQVKVRGHRVELGEVEAALLEHAAVREAVVAAREDARREKQLVAYVAPEAGRALNVSDLRGFLSEKLPGHMVPAVFVLLEELPRLPHGKVDLRALPPPEGARPELEGAYVAPRTEMERTIGRIWQEVLGLEEVGVYDNFFDLGGHSLLIVAVHTKLCEAIGRELPLIELFHHPTVSELAAFLARGGDAEVEAPQAEERVKTRRELTNRRRESRRRQTQSDQAGE